MAFNDPVDEILNFVQNSDDDFYKVLNCDQSSSSEQILTEYKILALKYHPDKNQGNKEAERRFQILNKAKETLLDAAKKTNYDKWRNSGIAISYQQWLNMNEHAQQSLHWANLKTDKRMLSNTEFQENNDREDNGPNRRNSRLNSNSIISKFRNYQI